MDCYIWKVLEHERMNERDDYNENPEDILSAVKQYEEQLKKNKSLFFDLNTFEELIEYYELQGKTAKALEAVDFAIGIYPFSSALIVKKASLLMQHRKYNEAIKLLDKAESIDPGEVSVYLLRSDILLQKGKHEECIEVIQKAMEVAEKDEVAELWLELADVYEDLNEFNKVFDCLKTSLTIDPTNEEALNRMWYSVDLSKRFEDSIDFHQKLIDDSPYSYLAWQNLGLAYFGMGLYEKAVESFEFVIAINETYDLAYRDCAETLYRMGSYHKAIEFYQKAIHYSRPFEDLYYCIGECYEKLKEYGKARLYYRKAVNIEPELDIAIYRIGITFQKEKQYHSALSFFKKAMRMDPQRLTFLMAAAKTAVALKDVSQLIEVSDRLIALSPKVKGFKAYEQIIQLLIQLNCLEHAHEFISIIEQDKGHSTNITLLKAVVSFKSGLRQQAIELLSQTLFADKNKCKLFFRLMPEMKNDNEVNRIIDIYT